MTKNTMANKLPRKLIQKMEIVGEQINYAFKFDENWLKVHAGILATLLQIPAREMAMFKERFKLNL